MTTTPPTPRRISLLPEDLPDLIGGFLRVETSFGEGWSVGLISDENALPQDEQITLDLTARGIPVLWLGTSQLLALAAGEPLWHEDEHGTDYQITVLGVEDQEG